MSTCPTTSVNSMTVIASFAPPLLTPSCLTRLYFCCIYSSYWYLFFFFFFSISHESCCKVIFHIIYTLPTYSALTHKEIEKVGISNEKKNRNEKRNNVPNIPFDIKIQSALGSWWWVKWACFLTRHIRQLKTHLYFSFSFEYWFTNLLCVV